MTLLLFQSLFHSPFLPLQLTTFSLWGSLSSGPPVTGLRTPLSLWLCPSPMSGSFLCFFPFFLSFSLSLLLFFSSSLLLFSKTQSLRPYHSLPKSLQATIRHEDSDHLSQRRSCCARNSPSLRSDGTCRRRSTKLRVGSWIISRGSCLPS